MWIILINHNRTIREDIMHRSAALFPIVLSLGATLLIPAKCAQADDTRDFGPTPIKRCQTIDQPGSYVLVKNLTATGDCLVITASFVTIDLAGFAIFGPGIAGQPAGVVAAQPNVDDIAVRNGSISGFYAGIHLVSRSSVVEEVRASSNGGAGIVANGIVRNNTAVNNSFTGIAASGVVTGNFAGDNGTGFNVGADSPSIPSTVIGNTATGNRNAGFSVTCPSNLIDNTASANGQNLQTFGMGCNFVNNLGF